MIKKTHLKELSKNSNTILAFYLVIEIEAKSINIAVQTMDDNIKMIKSELEISQIFIEKLKEKEILCLLNSKVSPRSQINQSFCSGFNVDTLTRDSIEEIVPEESTIFKNGIAIKIEDKYYRFYSIINLPQAVDKYW